MEHDDESGTKGLSTKCWELKRCGREPGGDRVEGLGVCLVAKDSKFDGNNRGSNGSRYCWRVEEPQGGGIGLPHWSDKERNCLGCEFFSLVRKEEGRDFIP